jgi:hypothetical protein
LTYMSIREEWKRLVDEGELFRLAPLDGDQNARTVLLTVEMRELLECEMEEGEEADRRSRCWLRFKISSQVVASWYALNLIVPRRLT